ncbi:uncharacterized protein BKA78DRAFT_323274 [Phyllosticta capitalensis]|uniref:uncharacterized protein n=1 Tax=Phyllosticta capitalensis TaxID=121624 RepID=UPI0031314988
MLRPRRRRPAPTTSVSSTGQTRRSAAIGASRCLPSSRSCSLSPFLWESSGTSRASTPDRRCFLPFWGLPTGLGATICSRNPHPAGPFDVLLRPASVSLLACMPSMSFMPFLLQHARGLMKRHCSCRCGSFFLIALHWSHGASWMAAAYVWFLALHIAPAGLVRGFEELGAGRRLSCALRVA